MKSLSKFKTNESLRMCLDMYARLTRIADAYRQIFISISAFEVDGLGLYEQMPESYDKNDSISFKIKNCTVNIDGTIFRKTLTQDYVFGPRGLRFGLLPLSDFKDPFKIIDYKPHE